MIKTMLGLEHIRKISRTSPSRIVLLVMDGIGGLPHPKTGKTELESAKRPNLNHIARESICGLSDPVSPGVTVGSAPGHLALFGYEPIEYNVGRGVVGPGASGLNLDRCGELTFLGSMVNFSFATG